MEAQDFLDDKQCIVFKEVLDNSPEGVFWLNEDGKFVYVNKATCFMEGYREEEFKDMYLSDIDKNFTKAQLPNLMKKVYTTEKWSSETTHQRKNGTMYPIEVSGHGFTYNGEKIICAFTKDITERRLFGKKYSDANAKLKKSLKEKEVLLKEIHHRVKNNMEIISSLLDMQSRRSDDIILKNSLQESRSRIHAMALVHEFLYLGDNLSRIDLPLYLNKLVYDIKQTCTSNINPVILEIEIESIFFSSNKCIQIGMVIHELAVNAFKYAFTNRKNNIFSIQLFIIEDQYNDFIELYIKDNGNGFSLTQDSTETPSIGMNLVHSIVEDQLDGTMSHTTGPHGVEYKIVFPRSEDC
ncbi:histidine kinase dimerization/phosphoacceptor domain -containing protein [Sulfurovum sp.]|uniref:sensor histidine kinase n=1 Tax=Sulfurovum sp. TaxID=1969726 RepID=UPI0028682E17|nr:histidine kinase dimerization/phosphoacceptor domain -containing protein [Sulfurovum sp.]